MSDYNRFKYFANEPQAVIPEGASGVLEIKTSRELMGERLHWIANSEKCGRCNGRGRVATPWVMQITDEMVEAGARAMWRSSTYPGYNAETLEREWDRMSGIWRRQVRQILEAALTPSLEKA